MKTRLYRIIFLIRTTPGHPQYSDTPNGLLCVYLFANSAPEVNERATAIIEHLPYELIREKAIVSHGDILPLGESPDVKQAHKAAIAMAWQVGIGLVLAFRPGGYDEKWIDDYFAAHAKGPQPGCRVPAPDRQQ